MYENDMSVEIKESKITRCEEIRFIHAWEDITSNMVYLTYPPQYPNKRRKCRNCGKEEELITLQEEIRGWK